MNRSTPIKSRISGIFIPVSDFHCVRNAVCVTIGTIKDFYIYLKTESRVKLELQTMY